jgi:hypothetical protein
MKTFGGVDVKLNSRYQNSFYLLRFREQQQKSIQFSTGNVSVTHRDEPGFNINFKSGYAEIFLLGNGTSQLRSPS